MRLKRACQLLAINGNTSPTVGALSKRKVVQNGGRYINPNDVVEGKTVELKLTVKSLFRQKCGTEYLPQVLAFLPGTYVR